jgi:putative transposase
LSQAIQLMKGGSSIWIKETLSGCRGFGWQDGYGAFSVSQSQLPGIEAYIRGQREHHRIKTFQEEYRSLLERHKIQFDHRYLWD